MWALHVGFEEHDQCVPARSCCLHPVHMLFLATAGMCVHALGLLLQALMQQLLQGTHTHLYP